MKNNGKKKWKNTQKLGLEHKTIAGTWTQDYCWVTRKIIGTGRKWNKKRENYWITCKWSNYMYLYSSYG